MPNKGIRILKVKKGSAAGRARLMPGDVILKANGREIDDELALRFYLSDGQTDLCIRRSNGIEEHILMDLPEGGDPGIRVEEFRTRTCNNACLFCFVDQLPSGARPGLRVKDDDFRLSFLHGNYITLTNVSEKDLNRIIEQRLSPLYVSVHAMDPVLRTRILGRKKADNLKRKLGALVRGGIQIHAQIVLMPGINDGTYLEKTVRDLHRFYPGVQSVAIVPLGLSDHGKPGKRLAPVTPDFSQKVIRAAKRWQEGFRHQTGRTFVYLADEFYIQGGFEIPERDYYDDFAQIEDGVGMARSFLDEFETELNRRRKSRSDLRGTLVTGKLFAPILKRCIARFDNKFGSHLQVIEAENRFLGKNITVAGLLGGQDILSALDGRDIGNFVIIPGEAVSQVGGIMVDGLSSNDLASRLGKPVFAGGRTMGELFRLLFERL
jgi:putative radical SAM enzyme (TIGR03279 family)